MEKKIKSDKECAQTISRRKFLQMCGSTIALGAIMGSSGVLLSRMYKGGKPTEGCQAYPNGVSDKETHCKKCGVKECPIRKGVNI